MSGDTTKLSKYLSLILRHKPETIGLELNKNGWAYTADLLQKINSQNQVMDFELLKEIVETNDKKRFLFNPDYSQIKANQGHSIEVELGLEAITPPEYLFHGTASRNLDSIRATGINKGSRHHVHLSIDEETARNVGQRYGKPVILKIRALDMHRQGIAFYKTANNVWLTDFVDAKFIE